MEHITILDKVYWRLLMYKVHAEGMAIEFKIAIEYCKNPKLIAELWREDQRLL